MIEINNYNTNSSLYNLHKKIIQNVQFSKDLSLANREELFIKDICKRIEKSTSVLYVFKNDDDIIGLIALSVTLINKQPSIQIDYIFISNQYRGQELEILDNTKPFRYLIEFTISIAKKLQKQLGIKYIVLSPDTDDLQDKYQKLKFNKIDSKWMFLKLK